MDVLFKFISNLRFHVKVVTPRHLTVFAQRQVMILQYRLIQVCCQKFRICTIDDKNDYRVSIEEGLFQLKNPNEKPTQV